MSIVGSKTPVSIVNEYFIASGITPSYQLIASDISRANLPKFVYRVSAGDWYADGEGTSKQQAKHNAAQLLLDIIKHSQEGEDSPQLKSAIKTLSLPQESAIGFNAVGSLTEFCLLKNYPEPTYDVVKDEGPPHARIFTFKCVVSHLTELGTARTKKQAKHQAAYAMLVYLKTLCGEQSNAIVLHTPKPPPADHEKEDEETTQKYLRLTQSQRFAANSKFIGDQYRSYAALKDKSATIARLAAAGAESHLLNQPLDALRLIGEEVGLTVKITRIDSTQHTLHFVQLQLCPILVRSGSTDDEAALSALNAILSML